MDLKLVGWGSEVGSSASTAVSFIGGPAMTYEFRSDGFYLTNVAVIPEPASIALSGDRRRPWFRAASTRRHPLG